MKYTITVAIVAMLTTRICPVMGQPAAIKELPIAEWGTAIDSSRPDYSIVDLEANSYIKIEVVTFYTVQKKGAANEQLTYRVRETKIFYKKTRLRDSYAYLEQDTSIAQYYVEGQEQGPVKPDDLEQFKVHKASIPMDEPHFRDKYKDYFPPPLQDWPTTSSTKPFYLTNFPRFESAIGYSQWHDETKEIRFRNLNLKLRYKIVDSTTCYRNGVIKVEERIESVTGYVIDGKGLDIPWNLENPIHIHLNGELDNKKVSQPMRSSYPDNVFSRKISSYDFKSFTAFRRKYDDLYWQYQRKPVLTFGFDYTPSYAFRSNHVIEQQFAHTTDQQARRLSEEGRYGQMAEARAGVTFGKRHTLYGSWLYFQGGFNGAAGIDWQTGLSATSTPKADLRTEQGGWGIGYNYTGYNSSHIAHGIFDATLLMLHNSDDGPGVRTDLFALRLGAGLSIRPSYFWDIHFMPTILYEVSSYNKGSILRTNLFNVGLTAGITIRPLWR